MSQELKPCPFCGGKPGYSKRSEELGFVICNGCGAGTDDMDTTPEADCVTVWNRRATPQGAPASPVGESELLAAAQEALTLAMNAGGPRLPRLFDAVEAALSAQPASPAPQQPQSNAEILARGMVTKRYGPPPGIVHSVMYDSIASPAPQAEMTPLQKEVQQLMAPRPEAWRIGLTDEQQAEVEAMHAKLRPSPMADPGWAAPQPETGKLREADARDLLSQLVEALDATNWSSWQTTARFSEELDRARAALEAHPQEGT